MYDLVKQEGEDVRFWSYATPEQNSGCWLWLGATTDNGYGSFWADGRSHRAHRFAYAQFVGPIPSGLTLDHLCRNRICVNPKHLEPVTDRENILRCRADRIQRQENALHTRTETTPKTS